MKIVTMGEIMLRLSPEGIARFGQAVAFEAAYGGAEANVAVALAQWGEQATFVSKVPANEIGQSAVRELKKYGVDTGYIAGGPGRMGIYFLEKGASQRPSRVIYDRERSAFSQAGAEDFPLEELFCDCGWFHFTGITPALSDTAAMAVKKACIEAKKAGATVSCDINYRRSLWEKEKAGEVLGRLMEYVDVCISNPEQAEDVFGIRARDSEAGQDESVLRESARMLAARFGLATVAYTQREGASATDNILSAMLLNKGTFHFSRKYPVHIIDRVGGGDAFAAGLIYGLTHGFEDARTVEFAAAADCLKHTVEGDFLLAGVDEVFALAGGAGVGRIQR